MRLGSDRLRRCSRSARCRASAAELEMFLTEGKQDRAQIGSGLTRSSSAEGTLSERVRAPREPTLYIASRQESEVAGADGVAASRLSRPGVDAIVIALVLAAPNSQLAPRATI